MSNIDCNACSDLREYAAEFIQNGVTETISDSLKADTGLNPNLTVLHSNCEDLNDVNDCLIGRMSDVIETQDVCDWKTFMGEFLPNLYETLKAIIASTCGLWTRVHALCAATDTLLNLIRASTPKKHPGTFLQAFLDKVEIKINDEVIDNSIYHPSFDADILAGASCTAGKKIGRWQVSTYWDTSKYVNAANSTIRLTADVAEDEVIGTIPKSAVPASDLSNARWKTICRNGGLWQWYVINRNTIWYIQAKGYVKIDGVEYNSWLKDYGEETLVLISHSFIGASHQGGLSALSTVEQRNYDA